MLGSKPGIGHWPEKPTKTRFGHCTLPKLALDVFDLPKLVLEVFKISKPRFALLKHGLNTIEAIRIYLDTEKEKNIIKSKENYLFVYALNYILSFLHDISKIHLLESRIG